MKKYILSIIILSLFFACNETAAPPGMEAKTINDSLPSKNAANPIIPPVNPGKRTGYGLTQEEMMDDSVFTDGSIPTSWEVAGFTDRRGFKLFLKQLQLLVLNNDKEQLALYIRYPLGRTVKTEKDFIKKYDALFTKDVKLSIAKLNFSQIFRNSKGAMSEDGRVWFSQEGDDFKIIAINNQSAGDAE